MENDGDGREPLYRFGPYRLAPGERQLTCRESSVPLPPKLFLPSALPSPYFKSAGVLSAAVSAGVFVVAASIAAQETMAAANRERGKLLQSITLERTIGLLLYEMVVQSVIVAILPTFSSTQ